MLMLFKIGNLLIQSESESEAQTIFQEITGINIPLPVTTLIGSGENYTYITPDISSIDTIDTMYNNCISCINDRYQDTSGAVSYMMKYASSLGINQFNGIFQALLETKYNETLPILTLLESMNHIPREWFKQISRHVSRFWIRLDYDTDTWYVDYDNLALLARIGETSVPQYSESELHIEELENASSDTDMRRLLNSINYSYDSLFEFVDVHPNHSWILDHYIFKQKVIRDGLVKVTNDTNTDGIGKVL